MFVSRITRKRERKKLLEKFDQEVHIKVSKRMLKALKKFSKDTGCTISWCIRHSTQYYLLKKGYYTEL